jgi:DNA-repair protein XRCC3
MNQLTRPEEQVLDDEDNDDLVEEEEEEQRSQEHQTRSQQVVSSFDDNLQLLLDNASQNETNEQIKEDAQVEHFSNTSHDSTSQDVYSMSEDAFDGGRGKLKIEEAIDKHLQPPYPFDDLIMENTQQTLPFPSRDELKRVFVVLHIFDLEGFINYVTRIDPTRSQLLAKLNERQPRKYIVAHVDRIVHDLSVLCLPRPVMDCLSLLQRTRNLASVLSTGSDVLDFALNGGFRTRCVSEIAGESSAGKTQFSLQLLIQSVLPRKLGGLEGYALYITSEGYPQDRMQQLAEHKLKQIRRCLQQYKHRASKRDMMDEQDDEFDDETISLLEEFRTVRDITDRIKVTIVRNHEQFNTLVSETLPNVCRIAGNIRCVIIDSIAALFRGENEFSSREGLMKRTHYFFTIANNLKILADQHNACVIVVNQVTSLIKDAIPIVNASVASREDFVSPITAVEARLYMWGPPDDDEDEPRRLMRTAQIMNKKIIPALGISWANCVNVSVMLTRTEVPVHANTRQDGTKRLKIGHNTVIYLPHEGDRAVDEREVSRQMHVIFAPHVKSNSVAYVVRETGVEGIE